MLLDSYDEPVIPYEFYQSCIDASDDHSLSRQVALHCSAVYMYTIYYKALTHCLCFQFRLC